ncbi:MAG: rhodanese-like domain-containing protein [Pyrinomonadaceae bacterium]
MKEVDQQIEIIAFYGFIDLLKLGALVDLRAAIRSRLREDDIRGTLIIAPEGYNGMVCGEPVKIAGFVRALEQLLGTTLSAKSSYAAEAPFRKAEVRIKAEIVTLRKEVDISFGRGTHVRATDWNDLISDPTTFVLDARNDYEFKTGTFRGAVNPETEKFSDLPAFVAENLDPAVHRRVAMFCTGGIRCEKFAPYLKQIGFEEVFQLEGGILKYLEEISPDQTLWEGECFVFDERITVDAKLQTGSGTDHSQRISKRKNPRYKVSE